MSGPKRSPTCSGRSMGKSSPRTFDEPAQRPRAGGRDGDRESEAAGRTSERTSLILLDSNHAPRARPTTPSIPAVGQGALRRSRLQCAAEAEALLRRGRANIEEGWFADDHGDGARPTPTGSRMDDIIFEEFKGTGKHGDPPGSQASPNKRVFPVNSMCRRSGTAQGRAVESRRRISTASGCCAKVLNPLSPGRGDGTAHRQDGRRRGTNADFLNSMQKGRLRNVESRGGPSGPLSGRPALHLSQKRARHTSSEKRLETRTKDKGNGDDQGEGRTDRIWSMATMSRSWTGTARPTRLPSGPSRYGAAAAGRPTKALLLRRHAFAGSGFCRGGEAAVPRQRRQKRLSKIG